MVTVNTGTASSETPNILGRAMLVNVKISLWEGRKFDKVATDAVAAKFDTAADAGRYRKSLFGGRVQELSSVITEATNLRADHYRQTLPWSDAGWRLLPTAHYFEYTAILRERIRKFETAVERFVRAYPGLRDTAAMRLGPLYNETEYPHPDQVARRFKALLEFAPLPAGEDFRTSLPEAEREAIASEIEARVGAATQAAMTAAYERLGDAVAAVRERLGTGRHLKAVLERLEDVAASLDTLNVTEDPMLKKLCVAARATLTTDDPKALRKDVGRRAELSLTADAILQQMAGIYTPPAPGEAITPADNTDEED